MRCGGRRRFSGPAQGDAAAKVGEDQGARRRRRSSSSGATEEEDEGERSDEGLWAGPIYKVRLISGREKRGGQGVIILLQKRLDF